MQRSGPALISVLNCDLRGRHWTCLDESGQVVYLTSDSLFAGPMRGVSFFFPFGVFLHRIDKVQNWETFLARHFHALGLTDRSVSSPAVAPSRPVIDLARHAQASSPRRHGLASPFHTPPSRRAYLPQTPTLQPTTPTIRSPNSKVPRLSPLPAPAPTLASAQRRAAPTASLFTTPPARLPPDSAPAMQPRTSDLSASEWQQSWGPFPGQH